MKISAYNMCILYRALKLHFTTDYDYVKYSGRVLYPEDNFKDNTSKYLFEKLANRLDKDDAINFIIANLLEHETIWIMDLVNNLESYENYTQYKKRIQSLYNTVENDLINIFDNNRSNILIANDGEYPELLKLLFRKEICIETVIILNDLMEIIPKWNDWIKDDIKYPYYARKIVKYGALLKYDRAKYRQLVRRVIPN